MSNIGTCETCRFSDAWSDDSAECRRSPPSVNLDPKEDNQQPYAVWPLVGFSEWCGAYELVTRDNTPKTREGYFPYLDDDEPSPAEEPLKPMRWDAHRDIGYYHVRMKDEGRWTIAFWMPHLGWLFPQGVPHTGEAFSEIDDRPIVRDGG